MSGAPDWPAASRDERRAEPVTVRSGHILTLDEVREWVAKMEAAGASGQAPAWGLTGAPGLLRGPGAGFPGGLAPLVTLGGYPRAEFGPVPDMPGQRERTPIEDEPPPGTAGG